MSSGNKKLIINTRERAVSTDINRAQDFISADFATLLRRRFNDVRQSFWDYPGTIIENSGAAASPLAAQIMSGLMVTPDLVTSLLVTGGVMIAWNGNPSGDDSGCVFVNDPGVTVAGTLSFTANGGPGVRLDVVEATIVETTLETSSRDIYNTTTGLFTATTVDKVKAFRLSYRIRLGTAGGGFPGTAAGYIPLAVIATPTSATGFDGCDLWDVRPLVDDIANRVQKVSATPTNDYAIVEGDWRIEPDSFSTSVPDIQTGIAPYRLYGWVESSYGIYKAGGYIRRSTAQGAVGTRGGTGNNDGETAFINLDNAENQGSPNAAVNMRYLACLFPGGLPRWVRYSQTSVGGGLGRVPRGPRGIICVTSQAPAVNGTYNANVTPPTASGFTAAASGVCLGAFFFKTQNACNGKDIYIGDFGITGPTGTTAVSNSRFTLTAGTHYPANATAILVKLDMTIGATVEKKLQISAMDNNGCIYAIPEIRSENFTSGVARTITLWIPLLARNSPTGVAAAPVTKIEVRDLAAANTFTAATSLVLGWRTI